MTIIDRIKPGTPKFVYIPKPKIFKTTLDKQRYWEKEKERWREGYGHGHARITGMHYFYMTQCHIPSGTEGTAIRPLYRDCDEWIFNEVHDHFWNAKGTIGLIKRRELGATSIGAACLPMYTARMFPSSTFGMTSCDQGRIYKAFTDKTMTCLNEMDMDIRPDVERKNETKAQTYLKLGIVSKNSQQEDVMRYFDLFSKETSETEQSAKGFSGTRMRAAYYDEFPLHRRKKLLLQSSLPCFMQGTLQSGFLMWAGTVEDMDRNQVAELQSLVEDSKYLRTKILFAPAWWGLIMLPNGESDEQAGIDYIMQERDRLSKLGDKSDLNAYIKNYPITIDEVFDYGKGGKWEEDVQELIKDQEKIIIAENPPITPVRISNRSGSITVEPVKESHTEILEHPRPGVYYKIGVDGTATSKFSASQEKDVSDIACVVTKMFDPRGEPYAPVCIYSERPKTLEQSYNIIANITRYYNKYGCAEVSAEGNAGTTEHFGAYMVKEGLGECLMKRRGLDGIIKDKDEGKFFIYRTEAVMEWQYRQANIFLRKYIDRIKFLRLIRDLLKPASGNADIEDAWLMCLVAMGANYDEPVQKKERRKIERPRWDNVEKKWIWETI